MLDGRGRVPEPLRYCVGIDIRDNENNSIVAAKHYETDSRHGIAHMLRRIAERLEKED